MKSPLTEMPNADVLPNQSAASALLNGHYAPPPADEDGKLWVRTARSSRRIQESSTKCGVMLKQRPHGTNAVLKW